MSRRALLLVLAALLMAGCRFERRAGGEEAVPGNAFGSGPPPADTGGGPAARDALLAFQGFREAGAVEEARAVLHPEARLLADGERYLAGAPESELRPLLSPSPELGPWTVSRVDTLDAGASRLYLLEYDRSGGDRDQAPGGVVESILLVRASGGWLVRLVHRSTSP